MQGEYEKILELLIQEDKRLVNGKKQKSRVKKRYLHDMTVKVLSKLEKWEDLATYLEANMHKMYV